MLGPFNVVPQVVSETLVATSSETIFRCNNRPIVLIKSAPGACFVERIKGLVVYNLNVKTAHQGVKV